MGPSFNVASACATASHSLRFRRLMILSGEADVLVAGGAEAATRLNTVAGFGNARALARSFQGIPSARSRPYDADRVAFVMGEGAGALGARDRRTCCRTWRRALAFLTGLGG